MAARPLPDRFNWTNNPNDAQSTDDLSFGLSGAATFASGTTTITVSSWPGSYDATAASGDGFVVIDCYC